MVCRAAGMTCPKFQTAEETRRRVVKYCRLLNGKARDACVGQVDVAISFIEQILRDCSEMAIKGRFQARIT